MAPRTPVKRPKAVRWDAPFEEAPEGAIREEIFSVERLESHAQALALEHLHGTAMRPGRRLAPRVRENGRVLASCYLELSVAVARGRPVPPDAKWLLENFHLVSGQWKAIKEDLPAGFYRELPKLGLGELKGYPRIYGLAWKWVAHCDSHFDSETLRRYIAAYQRTQPLTIGELWALPVTLRIVLLENLRRQAVNVVLNLRARERADRLADLLLGLEPGRNGAAFLDPSLVPKRFEGRTLPLAFSVRLFQRLKEQDAPVEQLLAWLSAPLGRQTTTSEAMARQEHQEQQARNATVKNIIISLRDIAFFDWPSLVEKLSLVDEIFRGAFDFQGLSFGTRDRYRHAVESLARGSRYSQLEIARMAAKNVLAARSEGQPEDSPSSDVGFDLIGPGSQAFERQIKYGPPLKRQVLSASTALGAPLYLSAILVLTAWALSLPLGSSLQMGHFGLLGLVVAFLSLIPASELAVTLANHAVMKLWLPSSLPSLALKGGVPVKLRCMVVMPVILEDEGGFMNLVEALEVHYLANADGDIFFGLLTDWPDAASEEKEGEVALLKSALAAIADLNRRHGPGPAGLPRFGLYQRHRRYNAVEGIWMGWERKRGKLMEFNRLLRGDPNTSYGPLKPPVGVRFVITLDQDTRLPRGSALKLIGTLAHPLNQPRLSAEGNRVSQGYVILQPRISPTLLPEEEATLFNRLSSGRAGADPYAFAVSDVYQDLFGEGSYTGKGIYDVDAFEACVAGRVPENSLLSHDLFEGSLARAGLVSDTEFFEEFPGHYQAAAARKHRWTRGDWQLLPWIFGFGARDLAPLGAISRWKMCDNLRRSLLTPASFLGLAFACFLPQPEALLWSAFVLSALALPPLLGVLVTELIPARRDFSLSNHWNSLSKDLGSGLLKFFFSAAMLPAEAWLMADAVCRTLFRIFISKRKLLEWTTAASGRKGLALGFFEFFNLLKAGPLAGLALLLAAFFFKAAAWPVALSFSLIWLVSPALCRSFSLPRPLPPLARLKPSQIEMLYQSARRTWLFFETFVDASVSHLPPDNFQEDPRPVLAERSSPTNLGLYLLSCVAAQDFGWLAPTQCLERVEKALDSMESMEKHQGHFYNWYELKTLKALEPKFVSTVDSGNLAGHLLVGAQALLELRQAPILRAAPCRGMKDSLGLAKLAAGDPEFKQLGSIHHHDLDSVLAALSLELLEEPSGAPAFRKQLARLRSLTETLADIAKSLSQEYSQNSVSELLRWSEALKAEQEGLAAYARMLLAEAPEGFNPPLEEAAAAYEALGLAGPAQAAASMVERLNATAGRMQALFDAMNFGFLYEPSKKLFSIGFRRADGALDAGCYDLLASEARLGSFLAVARGEVDTEHWFRLGRALAPVGRGAALLSWSGSMFEYLMPLLVMKSPPGSLLAETYRAVVRRQIQYGKERGLPWGVSESACNIRDRDMVYQYSDFGVEGLGFKGGLAKHKVVAPYATALALMVDPAAAASNLARLSAMGGQGAYGYYDALDFGAARFPEGQAWTVVRTFMAHHQGMALVSFLNTLKGGLMQARFDAVPMLKSAALLLQERTPRDVGVSRPVLDEEAMPATDSDPPVLQRSFDSPHMSLPQTHLLCNGSYSVMLTASGGGYSKWKKACVTRFRHDSSRDAWGSFIFIRDLKGGEAWSAAYLPSRKEPDSYHVLFREDKAEIIRRDGNLECRMEVAVSPEDDVEVRRLTLKNLGFRAMELELTSYAEVSLSEEAEDLAHPAFAKLFVQTEYVASLGALLAHRRPRASQGEEAWAAHLSFSESGGDGSVNFETDRARFLGRGRDIFNPAMVMEGRLFSNTVGAVLDPIFSLRRRLNLEPGSVAHVTFATMAAGSREKVLALAGKIRDGANVERLFGQAWTHAQVQMRHLGIQPEEARLFQALAGHLFYPDRRLRPATELLAKNRLGPRSLWGQGISSDLPILLLRIDEASDHEIVRQSILAWEYCRLKNLAVDLVILNEEPASYAADFQRSLEEMARLHQEPEGAVKNGGSIHVVKACLLPEAERDLLCCAARVILQAGQGSLSEQLARAQPVRSQAPRIAAPVEADSPALEEDSLEFMNGLGGFADGGREYRVVLEEGQETPAPWINVIANENFGFQVSESGSGYTWAHNARENKLSPWNNDPVSDPPGEAIYVRDEESGTLFTPTALPIRLKGGRYVARHGHGYSCFESTALGIEMKLTQFVPLKDPVKISRLVLKNVSGRVRQLSLTAYVEWVLGTSPQATAPTVVTELAADLGLLTARNPFNPAYPDAIAFLDVGGLHRDFTADKREFVGRHGSLARPQALGPGQHLSGRVGAGLDPCGALQSFIELQPGESTEFRVLLGQADGREILAGLLAAYRFKDLDPCFAEVQAFWDQTMGALQVSTPDRAMDLMLNHWLLYQALSCRIWARTAFYQCGGAYGFRDQLQDVLALTLARPEVAREQLLRAAKKQFAEGDVLHWWHPPLDAGVRTHISDDRLWLPYAASRYAEATGDSGVLDENLSFIEGPALASGAVDLYFEPKASAETATLYEHCARALDCSLKTGSHGLPLMGGGDWNDGMNKVGEQGRGESVWLAWFLVENLRRFAGTAEARGDGARALLWRKSADEISAAAEMHGWDGDWYRRAFFDDGSPLGSAGLAECRIDAIAQSWSVLSGAAEPARAARAMAALEEYLWKKSDRLQLLLTPPFSKTSPDPGYIMGYLPGIRENGGQYNHAAAWSVAAFAGLGQGAKAHELFSMINPVNSAGTRAGMQRYKVEPYVMAGDVYSQAPHVGRGGWSWYTGSAAWMYRAGTESILGLSLHGDSMSIAPCIPPTWPGFEMRLNWRGTSWQITVQNPDSVSRGVKGLEVDGKPMPGLNARRIPLLGDGKNHALKVVMGLE